ncbi:Glycosyl hydrolases family 25 [Ruminococcus sp. YE71]|uniref:GH25 family lysozyme n=1 Tax=unclassified Ruminococcus TaxID=2608920 RepID=UPI00088EB36C|nr:MULTISPECIES: GH25 family lysozyme [unclassified Ruminococcus]SDA09234.1 Glycosyl hydrolases family 25 [Ruminococcus sp. YE78]SFW12930.1 Glycosyl hydrolases family 25 [Ruminococcus sp. YE71]
MMKKTIGLLAALTLTLTSAGAVLPASAEEYAYDSYSAETDGTTADNGTDTEEAQAEAEQFAQENFDPQYGKYLKSLEAAEETAAAKANSYNMPVYGEKGSGDTDKYTGYTYTHQDRFNNCEKVIGIDVSYFQYQIDWKKVKADGVDFAIIRLGYRGYGSSGDLVLDYRFEENIKNAKAAGLQVGIYFYTQAITTAEAKEEADFCIKYLKNYSIDLPVYFDIESVDYDIGRLDSANLTVAQNTANCKAFCDRIIKAGYKAGVYANPYWLNYKLNAAELAKKYPIWLAHYVTYTGYEGDFSMWQYAYTGQVDGISTNVDMNVDYREKTAAPAKPDAPDDITATLNGNTAVLEWTPVAGADKYEVYRYNKDIDRYIKVNTVVSPKVTVSATGTVIPYTVRSVSISGTTKVYGEYSDLVYISNKIISGLGAASDNKSVTVSWNEISTANGYAVYRSVHGGVYTKIATVEEPSYTDTNTEMGIKYTYKVAPVFGKSDDDATEGALSTAVSAILTPKQINTVSQYSRTSSAVTIRFGHVLGASGYEFALFNPVTNAYKTVGKTIASASMYTFKSLSAGTGYQVCVRAYSEADGVTSYAPWSRALKVATNIEAPTILKTTITPSNVTVTWDAVEGAVGYKVYRRSGVSYIKLADTTSLSASFTDTSKGSRSYAVAGYFTANNRNYTSPYSELCTIDGTLPSTPSFTSGSNSGGNVTLKWSAVPNVTGYRVYMYNNTTGVYDNMKTINAKNTSCKLTGIYSTAKFRIKAFRRETGGTVWSDASAVKTVKY